MNDLVQRLADGVLVGDGAMGTMLHAAGNSLDQALPSLCVSDPELVRAVHDNYVDAGVDILSTNTFGAGRLRLDEQGLGERTEEINREAVRIARDAAAARPGVLVSGVVSPAVSPRRQRRADPRARVDAVREQVAVLADAGVDVVTLETFGDVPDLVAAAAAAVETTALPVIAQATFGPDLTTLSGHTPAEVVSALADVPLAAIGTNCLLGPKRMLTVVRQLRDATDRPLTASPNAGVPRRLGSPRFEYDIDAEYLLRYIEQLVDAGALVVGGCCGTTPTQMATVVRRLDEREEARRRSGPATVRDRAPDDPPRAGAPAFPAQGTRPLTVEIETGPAGLDVPLALASELADAGLRTLAVAVDDESPRPRIGSMDVALQLIQRLGVQAVASVGTWDRTSMVLQADLLGAHALGLRRVVCETGQPPPFGDYPHADGIWEVDSIGLVELLTGLNDGTDVYGLPMPSKTEFEIGARVTPGVRDIAKEVERTRRKVDAGARFLVTRPVYAAGELTRMLDDLGEDRPPVLATIRPLVSFDEAEYLAHEVPDVRVPASTLRTLERAGSGAAEAGLRLAAELAAELDAVADGLVVRTAGAGVRTVRGVLARCDLARYPEVERLGDAGDADGAEMG